MFRGILNLKINFSLASRIKRTIKRILSLPYKIERIQEALGRIESRQCSGLEVESSEFRLFSQWGEDGIIQHLLSKIPIQKKIFVEFGVEDYKGYSLVASNNAGNNAFFIRNDLISDVQVLSPVQAYRKACFREAKNSIDGQIEYQSIKERFENIKNYKVYNFDKNEIEFIRNINELNPDNFL